MSLSPDKIRAARALLNWSQEKLAEKACIGTATLKRLEKTEEGKASKVTPVVENAIGSALAAAGIILDPTPDDLAAGDIAACVAIRKIKAPEGRSIDPGKESALESPGGSRNNSRKTTKSIARHKPPSAKNRSAPE